MPTDKETTELLQQLYGETYSIAMPLKADDPDAAVLRSLALLTTGRPLDFCNHRWPPTGIRSWLNKAELRDVQGLLMATLRRWHELRKEVGK